MLKPALSSLQRSVKLREHFANRGRPVPFASNPPPIYAIPTAAPVSISGRVLAPNGAGLRNAQVVLTDENGATRTANTTSFGYYHFDGVSSGQSMVVSVNSKRYTFNTQIVSVQDNISDMNFYADEF